MSSADRDALRHILSLAAIVEVATGVALLIVPSLVVALLLGDGAAGGSGPLGRFLGIALLALGLACWPNRQRAESISPALRAMLTYNLLVALYLAILGALAHLAGPLLWPAVILHAAIGGLLAWTSRKERRTRTARL